mmetsp:Transcript_25111/g.42402  ORF Transcript_25111/g.42402 Transcript_25111/m.42402 type:complete len:280 (-) Transcript_25111:161-1000(-)|eukprot:CAMPEP_0114412932 /NCGR_PEP_ID=MMETSP0103-20121206/588_1 /TAXON_ID=37642 ORGANISM="Paraphysomonas imperforata, Strain PA2" /NCGR_SAMPLE_ID=MMETSP0103 /ASSEMBLY_ACC=CAM_ASM_000201 /LENGTH=279 /DNA_ID=CAMNT_0001580979 /DNA_START=56 /DNA_END=895 /DNA_ORIENTATION=+
MSEDADTFTFVLIPCADKASLRLLERHTSGGLEKDALQKEAKLHFASELDGEINIESIKATLREQGKDPDALDPNIFKAFAARGASVEICTLCVPHPSLGYIGVSLYCDGTGKTKGLPVNSRATAIARACGHAQLEVFGDCYLSRYYDNEAEEWQRRSMSLEEASVDAPWVQVAAKMNSGKNMGAYTSSGSAASSLQAVINNRNKQVTLGFKMCGNVNCGRVEDKMGTYMACSRCKKAHYCSKACQVANWKVHKKTCKAVVVEEKTPVSNLQPFGKQKS